LLIPTTCIVVFFLCLTRPPPRSTLFPYTTLFRSHRHQPRPIRTRRPFAGHPQESAPALSPKPRAGLPVDDHPQQSLRQPHAGGRSEEHTSELQSREKLVCRLLLEKKKK